jgi:tRNA (guanosine-2'-O-)-methyltransferase
MKGASVLPFFLHTTMKDKLIQHLQQFVTERRLKLFESRLESRTRYLTIVLEDIFQPHNASAVLRSCECFGIQDLHIIENRNAYHINPDVALGSYKWLTLKRYNQPGDNTTPALLSLKKEGYRVVAAMPHKNDCKLEDFDLSQGKTALVFGSELEGLSPTAVGLADEFIHVPMVGFTESLNISVSAAICIHHLTSNLRKSDLPWHLKEDEKKDILLAWLKKTIKKSDQIEQAFLADPKVIKKSTISNSDPTIL